MGTLIDSYKHIFEKINDINDLILEKKDEIHKRSVRSDEDIQTRIYKLEDQIGRVDEYLKKVIEYQVIAKDHLESLNVLTIDAPPGYRVNLNRLQIWSSMIDPLSSNDPYAQRVYLVSKCDEFFLMKKKKDFQERIEELKTELNNCSKEEIEVLSESVMHLEEDLDNIITGDEFNDFINSVLDANSRSHHKVSPFSFTDIPEKTDTVSPGAYLIPVNIDTDRYVSLKDKLGECFDIKKRSILIPAELDNKNVFFISVFCPLLSRKTLDSALQNLAVCIIESAPAGTRKLYFIDAVRFNTSAISCLTGLEDSRIMEKMPANTEQVTALLEDIIKLSDVSEAEKKNSSYLFIYGWPTSYSDKDRELIQKIMTEHERFGVSVITVSYDDSGDGVRKDLPYIPEDVMKNVILIDMDEENATIKMPDADPLKFSWYCLNENLSEQYIEDLLSIDNPA